MGHFPLVALLKTAFICFNSYAPQSRSSACAVMTSSYWQAMPIRYLDLSVLTGSRGLQQSMHWSSLHFSTTDSSSHWSQHPKPSSSTLTAPTLRFKIEKRGTGGGVCGRPVGHTHRVFRWDSPRHCTRLVPFRGNVILMCRWERQEIEKESRLNASEVNPHVIALRGLEANENCLSKLSEILPRNAQISTSQLAHRADPSLSNAAWKQQLRSSLPSPLRICFWIEIYRHCHTAAWASCPWTAVPAELVQ